VLHVDGGAAVTVRKEKTGTTAISPSLECLMV
jgi:hypothetical protein